MSLATPTERQPRAPKITFNVTHSCGHLGNATAATEAARQVALVSAKGVKCPFCRKRGRTPAGGTITPAVRPNWEHTSEQLAAEAKRLHPGAVCKEEVQHSCGCPATAWWNTPELREWEIKQITSRPCSGCWPIARERLLPANESEVAA